MAGPLSALLERFDRDDALAAAARGEGDGVVVADAGRPYFLAGLAVSTGSCVLAVVGSEQDAESLAHNVAEYGVRAAVLPAWDVLPYEGLSPDPRLAARRIEALHVLRQSAGPRVVVASVRGFIQKPSPAAGALRPVEVARGAQVDRDRLLRDLAVAGYTRQDVAQEPGTFAVRGGIVDIFPATMDRVIRIELFGDDVESIRTVDPVSQRSTGDLDRAVVFPRTELPPTGEIRARAEAALGRVRGAGYLDHVEDLLARIATGASPEGGESVLPFVWEPADGLGPMLGPGTIVVEFDPKRCEDEAAKAVEQEEELASLWADPARLAGPVSIDSGPSRVRVEEQVLFLPREAVLDSIRAAGRVLWEIGSFAQTQTMEADVQPWTPGLGPRALLDRCRELLAAGHEVVVCAHPQEAASVGVRLAEEDLRGARVVTSTLRGGFVSDSLQLAVVTHQEWHARPHTPIRPRRPSRPRALQELREGDLVVHALHGIGRYVGMETREVAGFVREYLVCEYANGDRLFVPSDTAESLQRYLGSEQPKLSRLGTADWERTTARVKKRVRDIAAQLIQLYSARLHSPGHAYPEDSPWQRELEESFPFDETPDQLRAIHDVYGDMAREMPMDRLVCGDVGYGKTEVAVRAAFKAVTDGRQVAVLVPTTLLAQQHSSTFRERLEAFGVNIATLSRFQSPSEQAAAVAGIEDGSVDIAVGTHRLLGKDVRFKNLGLLILDEEHRFGVAQKEHLKRMRVEVDVLTLTATPIPRTLEMSMSGIRDLSVIETAPAERRPVRTFVGPFDERVITAAIRRELARSGQVFHVHNRVQTIGREARRLERLVPEARVRVAHGQMDEDVLEATMVDFLERRIDVLLCTTIIEAGLDIPTVNTLVVDHADKLGLAQLYQLRGRVGRAGEQAYAYLFYPATTRLTETAHERLKTLATYTELGSGMAIALKDLEIRGAGNVLGAEQHGHIEAVGFEMYVRLLEEATRELKGEEAPAAPSEIRIDVPVDAYLPSTYIDSEPLRLAAYRRVAETQSVEDVAEARAEFEDRFGPLPDEASALLRVAELRATVRRLGVTEIAVAPHELHGRVARIKPFDVREEWRSVRLKRKYPRAVVSAATSTLILPVPDLDGVELVDFLDNALSGLLAPDP